MTKQLCWPVATLGVIVAISTGSGVAHASPESEVEKVLTGGLPSGWGAQNGATWEKTTDNTILQIVHSPMNSWGVSVERRPSGGYSTCKVVGETCEKGTGLCQLYEYFRTKSTDLAPLYCGKHSDKLLNDVWTLIANAKQQVDITTLFDPSDAFEVVIQNAIQFAANEAVRTNAAKPLTVRVVVGESHAPPWMVRYLPASASGLLNQESHPKELAERYGKALSPEAAAKINIFVGEFKPSVNVWNHAKMIAVDGEKALVGGHNLWDGIYTDPDAAVHDVSVLVGGSAARSAHKYANVLWDVICSWPEEKDLPGGQTVWTWNQASGEAVTAIDVKKNRILKDGKKCRDGIAKILPPEVKGTGTTKIYGVGKTGLWMSDSFTGGATGSGKNPSDVALVGMIKGSKSQVLISQQNLSGPDAYYADQLKDALGISKNAIAKPIRWLIDKLGVQGAWTSKILHNLAQAATRGVKVRIIISDPDNLDGAYQSAGAIAVIDAILGHWPPGGTPEQKCNIEVVHFRDSHEHGARNHPKVVIADPGTADAGYYIGSQNLYGNDLSEYGYMVFGQAETATLMTDYWQKAWLYSAGVAEERVFRGCGPGDNARATEVYGQANFVTGTSNAGGVNPASLHGPTSVSFSHPNMFVSDAGNARALWYDFSNSPATIGLYGQPNYTTGTAPVGVDEYGVDQSSDGNRVSWAAPRLVIADTKRNRVLAIDYGTPTDTGEPTVRALGQADAFSSTAGATNAGLNAPAGVWTDGTKVIVADTGNHRVMIWNAWPASDGAAADLVLGQPDFTTVTAGASDTKMKAPRSVDFEAPRLVVVDTGNNRVLLWNTTPTTNGMKANVAIGQADMAGSASALTAKGLNGPSDADLSRDALVVADTGNHRVLYFSPLPAVSGAAAKAVIGQPNMTSAAVGAPTQQSLKAPQGVSMDRGRLFVADHDNHRVLEFRAFAPNFEIPGESLKHNY